MLIPSLMWEYLCMAQAEGIREITPACPVFTSLWKETWWKKPQLDHELKIQVYFFSWVEQSASDPKTLSPGGKTLSHWADRAGSWLQKQHSSSEQISSKPTSQHSCCSPLSPLLAHSAQRGRDLAAFFCSTRLFILLPKAEQPSPQWAGHLALQGWINNHNGIFVRLSEWTMYPQTPAPLFSIFNFKNISIQSFTPYVKYSTCYISLVLYPYF